MSADTMRGAFTDGGRRTTKQRRAVAAVVDDLEVFSSSQSIFDILRSQGESVGLSTVYRNLQALAEAGSVDSLRSDDGEMLYRKCGTQHHHHLVCRECGRAVEISGAAVERWTSREAAEHGFTEVSHSIEVFGLCPACADQR